MENSLTDSPPIDPSNTLMTTTSPSDFEKRMESCLVSANSLQVNDGSTASPQLSLFTLITDLNNALPISPLYSLNVSSIASPIPTAVVPAPIQAKMQPSKDDHDQMYIDTKDLCTRIAYELSQHSIPQSVFAEKILNRSQGTLSDLLHHPKPWSKLHPMGRQTFLRMFDWLKQPLHTRLRILAMHTPEPDEMEKEASVTTSLDAAIAAVSASAAAALFARKKSSVPRRPRTIFTTLQKRTLQEILKHTDRPSREMQVQIAHHLKLDLSTVANYFMNARRRARINDENDAAAVAVSPVPLSQQLDAVMNDHAFYYQPQDTAEVQSGN